ncbi:MAG: DNA repair protein RadC [Rickettsiaceae bacterium]
MTKDEPHYLGHRNRLKQKFIHSQDPMQFADYELLELLLFFAIPRKDVKPIAKQLLKKLTNLTNVLHASKEHFSEYETITDNVYILFYIIRVIISKVQKDKIQKQHVISSWNDLVNYLKFTMSNLKKEVFKILFLNKANVLISEEDMTVGTVDHAHIYPREVIKKALILDSSAIILVHNHPSGNVNPSACDIEITHNIKQICLSLDISLHDHIIIAQGQYFSFKSNMLL